MTPKHRAHKTAVRGFLRAHYTDEKLAALYAHIRDGKFSFFSCCCLIGIPTATHALRPMPSNGGDDPSHYRQARYSLAGAVEAEIALMRLMRSPHGWRDHPAVLLPFVRAEMKRRDTERAMNSIVNLVASCR